MFCVNVGPHPLLTSNRPINLETKSAGKAGEFSNLLNFLMINNMETGFNQDFTNTPMGKNQQQFFDNILEMINMSKDSLLDSIKKVLSSVFENEEGNIEQNSNDGLEISETSNNVMDLINLNDPTQLDVSIIVSFVQFLSQFDLSTVVKNTNETDLSNVLKIISTLYQLMEMSEGQSVPLTEEQQQGLKNYVQQLQKNNEKFNILETAFRPLVNHEKIADLSVFRNKQPTLLILEQNLENQGNQVDGQVTNNKIELIVSQAVSNLSRTDNENQPLPLPKQTGEMTEVKPIQLQQLTSPSSVAGTIEILDDQNQPITMERFVKDFESIVARSKFYQNGQMQKLTIQLKPDHLGTLKIELIQQQNELIAKITSTTVGAKEILESQIHALKHALVQQNVNVSRIDITNDLRQEAYNEQSNQKQNREQSENQQQQEEQHDKSEDNFLETFIDKLLNYEI